jgi:hypothetical protein
MNTSSRRMLPALAGVALTLFLLMFALAGAASAEAAGPATVTVRVIGANGQSLLPLTQVTTTTTPVVKDGKPEDSCMGASAAGALELATKGAWDGEWNSSFGYGVETIEGVSYPFTQPDYWAFWIDNKSSPAGVCDTEISAGDSLLFFVECYSETSGVCPPTPPNVLAIEAPSTAEVGKPTTVTVLSYPNAGGEPKPAIGATVTGGGATTAPPTNAQGQTTLTLSTHGIDTLRATGAGEASSSIPGEAFVCVHEGNDGNCGTSVAGSGISTGGGGTTTVTPNPSSRTAITASISSLLDGHVYARHKAPRILAGTVTTTAPLEEVELRLTRRGPKGRCSYFDGVTGRFHAMRCGAANGKYFKASNQKLFSYLLPETLAPGRYVLDAQGIGVGGHVSSLVRGTSRIVFYVK